MPTPCAGLGSGVGDLTKHLGVSAWAAVGHALAECAATDIDTARIEIVASGEDPQQVEEKGGSLLAQISNAFVTMQKQYWGIGPLEAKSYMMDDLLLIVMRGGLTRSERTMLDFGQHDLVRNFRQTFENEMTQNLTGKIEELTGRKVLTYQSQILFDPDIVAELFVFDKAAGGGADEIVATAQGQLRERPHGRIHDATGASTDAAPTGAEDASSDLR